MSGLARSALLAGLISAVIWMIIATAVDLGKIPVIIGGLAFLVGTGLITALISSLMDKARSTRP